MRGDTYSGDRRRFTLYQPDELRAKSVDAGFTITSVDAGADDDDWIQLLLRA
jgi:hypothetical protein